MRHSLFYFILLACCFNSVYGQFLKVYPGIGIESVPVKIDSTTIAEVIDLYGPDFRLDENPLVSQYIYKDLGLGFEIITDDKNKIVRTITVKSPIDATLANGIRLNRSTMQDVWDVYNGNGCFTNSTEAWHSQEGVTFYIRKERKKRGFNLEEKIYKIEVHNKDDLGLYSRAKFEFDDDPYDRKLDVLFSFLEEEEIDLKALQAFLDEEHKQYAARKPHALDIRTVVKRDLELGLNQQNLLIGAAGRNFELNLIKRNDSLIYLKLEQTRREYQLIIERDELNRFKDLKSLSPDFDVFVFGTSCGFAGMPPSGYSKMNKLAANNDYQELSRWLHSINPERAVYGYIGLYFLKRSGVVIRPSEVARMEQFKDSDISLYYCQGCLYGGNQPIITFLSRKQLRWLYSDYKNYFLLKK
ncbi:MAG: hypothetical protein Aureis2KO_09940 [Aureisphaera sp.]